MGVFACSLCTETGCIAMVVGVGRVLLHHLKTASLFAIVLRSHECKTCWLKGPEELGTSPRAADSNAMAPGMCTSNFQRDVGDRVL